MALINNEGEPVSRAWVSKALSILKTDKEIFSTSNMRRARLEFIAGKNRLVTIKLPQILFKMVKIHAKKN